MVGNRSCDHLQLLFGGDGAMCTSLDRIGGIICCDGKADL